jgi:hypothetical protein
MSATGFPNLRSGATTASPASMPPLWQTKMAMIGLPWLPKDIHGKPIIAIFVCHSGGIEAGEAVVAPLGKFGKPVAGIVTRRPYTQIQSLPDATQPKGRRYYWKSHYLAQI